MLSELEIITPQATNAIVHATNPRSFPAAVIGSELVRGPAALGPAAADVGSERLCLASDCALLGLAGPC